LQGGLVRRAHDGTRLSMGLCRAGVCGRRVQHRPGAVRDRGALCHLPQVRCDGGGFRTLLCRQRHVEQRRTADPARVRGAAPEHPAGGAPQRHHSCPDRARRLTGRAGPRRDRDAQ
jgi:hypothetical protein